VIAPDLPFDDPYTTYEQRAQRALEALQGHDEPVVIVGHSLATGYAPLVAAAQPQSSIVYLCPAPVGPFAATKAPMPSTRAGFTFPPERPDGTSVWEPGVAVERLYSRLPTATARQIAACLRPGASPANTYPLEEPVPVPTTFIYASHDEFFEPAWSRWVARDAGLEPIELDTGHFPMAEAPIELTAILDRAA